MTKKLGIIFFLGILFFCQGQQNKYFKEVKNFFDYQKLILNKEFKKRLDKEPTNIGKIKIQKEFNEFILKLESIQNNTLVNTLVKVKIQEDLMMMRSSLWEPHKDIHNPPKNLLTNEAIYPGGFERLRKQIIDIFYADAILTNQSTLKTVLFFMVEIDGSISSVHAVGDHLPLNRQAEIALYLLPEKFSPAMVNGNAIRYRFSLPLTINFNSITPTL